MLGEQIQVPMFTFGEWHFNLFHIGGARFQDNGNVTVIVSGALIELTGKGAQAFTLWWNQATGQARVMLPK